MTTINKISADWLKDIHGTASNIKAQFCSSNPGKIILLTDKDTQTGYQVTQLAGLDKDVVQFYNAILLGNVVPEINTCYSRPFIANITNETLVLLPGFLTFLAYKQLGIVANLPYHQKGGSYATYFFDRCGRIHQAVNNQKIVKDSQQISNPTVWDLNGKQHLNIFYTYVPTKADAKYFFGPPDTEFSYYLYDKLPSLRIPNEDIEGFTSKLGYSQTLSVYRQRFIRNGNDIWYYDSKNFMYKVEPKVYPILKSILTYIYNIVKFPKDQIIVFVDEFISPNLFKGLMNTCSNSDINQTLSFHNLWEIPDIYSLIGGKIIGNYFVDNSGEYHLMTPETIQNIASTYPEQYFSSKFLVEAASANIFSLLVGHQALTKGQDINIGNWQHYFSIPIKPYEHSVIVSPVNNAPSPPSGFKSIQNLEMIENTCGVDSSQRGDKLGLIFNKDWFDSTSWTSVKSLMKKISTTYESKPIYSVLDVNLKWYEGDLQDFTFEGGYTVADVVDQPWILQPPNGGLHTSAIFKVPNSKKPILDNLQDISEGNVKYVNTLMDSSVSLSTVGKGAFGITEGKVYVLEKDSMPYLVFIFIETNPYFWLKCCANVITDNARYLCPSKLDNKQNCKPIGECICGENGTDPLNKACGCYQTYIQKMIVDKNPTLKNILGGAVLQNNCTRSCSNAVYDPKEEACTLTICNNDFSKMQGQIKAHKINITQDCKNQGIRPSSGNGGDDSGGDDSGGSDDPSTSDGGGNGSKDGSGKKKKEQKKKKDWIVWLGISLGIGGLFLLFIIIIVLYKLF